MTTLCFHSVDPKKVYGWLNGGERKSQNLKKIVLKKLEIFFFNTEIYFIHKIKNFVFNFCQLYSSIIKEF